MSDLSRVRAIIKIINLGMMGNTLTFWKFWSSLLFLLLILTQPAEAEEALTLDQLTHIALQNNKELQVVKHNVEIATARLTQAGQYPNPRLNLLNADDRLLKNEGEYVRSAGISQQFPIAGRIGSQENVARVDIEVALAEIKNAERKLKGDIASAFYTLLIISYRIEKMNAFLAVAQKLMEVTRKRYKVAEISQLDVNSAQLEHERLLQERNLLEKQYLTQTAKLNELLGRSACSPLEIDKKIPKILICQNLEDELTLAQKQRPDLRIAELSINRAKADSDLAHAQKWEDWTVGVGVEQDLQVIT
ncbi:MAG: TolC family protein, partial [Ignavibacteria bacterium]|nr:TolC family protein [Ignavibacteria bacterium]